MYHIESQCWTVVDVNVLMRRESMAWSEDREIFSILPEANQVSL